MPDVLQMKITAEAAATTRVHSYRLKGRKRAVAVRVDGAVQGGGVTSPPLHHQRESLPPLHHKADSFLRRRPRALRHCTRWDR